jgi:hypothetical protein
MKISNTHQRLSNYLKNPDALTNPEPFLGPNWETVLRWWLFEESLTYEQKNELHRRISAFDEDTRNLAEVIARYVAIKVIGSDTVRMVGRVSLYPSTAYELVAMHKLDNPFFLPHLDPEFKIQPAFLPLMERKETPQTQDIFFNPETEVFIHPIGNYETLIEYSKRIEKLNYISELQESLETMKILYKTPGAMTEADYNKSKERIQESFDYYEANLFTEFGDAY